MSDTNTAPDRQDTILSDLSLCKRALHNAILADALGMIVTVFTLIVCVVLMYTRSTQARGIGVATSLVMIGWGIVHILKYKTVCTRLAKLHQQLVGGTPISHEDYVFLKSWS